MPGQRRQMQVGDGGGRRPIRIDHDKLRAAFLSSTGYVGHDVDLGRHRIAAPHHDQVGFRHLAGIDTAALSNAGVPADFRQRSADRHLLPRIPHDVAQPVDPVALHQAHGASVIEWPHCLGAMLRGGVLKFTGDAIQRLVPRDAFELRRTFRGRCAAEDGSADQGDECARRNG